MDLGLKGQVALVTAASRGLGAAVAQRFAMEGAQVALCARDLSHAQTTAEYISKATGSQVVGFKADVTLPDAHQRIALEGTVNASINHHREGAHRIFSMTRDAARGGGLPHADAALRRQIGRRGGKSRILHLRLLFRDLVRNG